MSPNDVSCDFDKIFLYSSGSSDSESLLEEDLNGGENQTNKEWEAIERTLYQEEGQQVTNPDLLKECKLWRGTFPHFRVKGTKIDVPQTDDEGDKCVQTIQNHMNLKKLEEKRESIKNKVVGELVERIIAKFSLSKECSPQKNSIQVTEIHDKLPKTRVRNNKESAENAVVSNTEKESYFERGKLQEESSGVTREEMEESLREIFDSWENEIKPVRNKTVAKDPKKNSEKEIFGLKCVEKPVTGRPKPTQTTEYLSSLVKPIEMTKKIDKKYEGLLDKIMERRYNEMIPIRHCRKINSGVEMRTYQESLEKLRTASGFEGYSGKNKNLPKINKFSNNWLERGEVNSYRTSEEDFPLGSRANRKTAKNSKIATQNEIDDRFIEELKREMMSNYKRPPKRSDVFESVSLRRPKPLKFNEKPERTQKSSSCGDLPKKVKKEPKSRHVRGGPENGRTDSNFKSRAKTTNLNNKGNKLNGGKNLLLPPIESGIICTELTGRPKIGPRNPPKKR